MNLKALAAAALIAATGFATPAMAGYKFTKEEAKMQYSFFYTFSRRSGKGHYTAASNAKRALKDNGFPPVPGKFRSTVMKCFDNTGDAYCWDN